MTARNKTSHAVLAALAVPALAIGLSAPATQATAAPSAPTHVHAAGGLDASALHARGVIAERFDVDDIGGYRPGRGKSDHHTGKAIDVMVSGAKGDEIAAWVQAHAEELDVKYVIWEQGYWQPGMTGYRHMKDRGSSTANHYDHVHVSFSG